MMITRYRLIYRDGSQGAWSTDYDRIKESAKFFNATIEKWEILEEEIERLLHS